MKLKQPRLGRFYFVALLSVFFALSIGFISSSTILAAGPTVDISKTDGDPALMRVTVHWGDTMNKAYVLVGTSDQLKVNKSAQMWTISPSQDTVFYFRAKTAGDYKAKITTSMSTATEHAWYSKSGVTVTQADIKFIPPAGCPGGPLGPALPGTTCADGTIPNPAPADPSVVSIPCSPDNLTLCPKDQCAKNGGHWGDASGRPGDSSCIEGATSGLDPSKGSKPDGAGDGGISATSGACKDKDPTFFGLVPWYKYLERETNPVDGSCEIVNFNALGNGSNSGVLLIVLAIIDDLLRIAGIVAVAFVIVAGFKLMTAQGEPEKVASGRKTLVFALIGLAIAILAVAVVSFIGKAIGS